MSSDRIDQLLLGTLARAAKPATSDTLLDLAYGEALAAGWTPTQAAPLTRRVVAARLQRMEKAGTVRRMGFDIDGRARRTTPTFALADGNNPPAIPAPPSSHDATVWQSRDRAGGAPVAPGPRDTTRLSREQLTTLLDCHDQLLDSVSRFLSDLASTREKVRQRLVAVGLGDHG